MSNTFVSALFLAHFYRAYHYRSIRAALSRVAISSLNTIRDANHAPNQSSVTTVSFRQHQPLISPHIPSGFSKLESAHLIDRNLIHTIGSIWSLASILNDCHNYTSCETAVNSFEESRWRIETKLHRLRASFLSYSYSSANSDLYADSDGNAPASFIEQPVCLAVILYTQTSLREMPRNTLPHSRISGELIVALLQNTSHLNDLWGSNWRALLWVIFTGYESTTKIEDKMWFIVMLRRLLDKLRGNFGKVQSLAMRGGQLRYQMVMEILHEFLWSSWCQQSSKELWEQAHIAI
jgi:hypothetical protein